MIKWLKLPLQLFCSLIAKLSAWLRDEVVFDLLLPYFVSGRGPSGGRLVSWHLNHMECQMDHLAALACQKTCAIQLCLGSNRCSRRVRQRTTAERGVLLKALFSGRIRSVFISVMVVETHQIPMFFQLPKFSNMGSTTQIKSVHTQFCIALPDVTGRTENGTVVKEDVANHFNGC